MVVPADPQHRWLTHPPPDWSRSLSRPPPHPGGHFRQRRRGPTASRPDRRPDVSPCARIGNKNPPKKTHLKKPTKNVFDLGFFKFFIFYENNTNFSVCNRFFMNK
jgi:hypothetical protein